MPPLTRLICLANSRKHGAHCVAGIVPDSGEWIRPVSELDDGRLTRKMRLVEGREPELLEVLGVPVGPTGPGYGFEKENRSLLPGEWRSEGKMSPDEMRDYCVHGREILGGTEPFITVEHMESLPPEERTTLELVETRQFSIYHTGRSAQGGHKWHGRMITTGGARLDARITDPIFVERLERGHQPGNRCLVTISLSMPYRPDSWQEETTPCWKLIAAVIELTPHSSSRPRHPRDTRHSPPDTRHAPRDTRHATPDTPHAFDDARLYLTLKRTFGYHTFRAHQKPIVQAVLAGRDAFVVMPSGGGKSLCYQLPAAMMSGTCVVVSPLIALMKDQVDNARANGLSAACFNSSQTPRQRVEVLERLDRRELDLLYISPERLVMDRFRNELKRSEVGLFAIDEAHCISEWGHDFRPDYLYLTELKKHFPGVCIAAFTATATPRVQKDIVRRLHLEDPHVVRASFNRPNFFYQVKPKGDVPGQILDFVGARKGQCGVVYRTTRDDVEFTAEYLAEQGISALPYHAGLDRETRRRHQEQFQHDEVNVMVATIAFGMGIDKPNVRFVVHGDLPKNLESYYQETGRAGRDGEPAHCLLLFSEGDAGTIRYFIGQMEEEQEQERCSQKLSHMIRFGSVSICRRRQLLEYFGEAYEKENCGSCDVCTEEVERTDATREAQIVMSAIARTNERFGMTKVVDIVTGADTKEVRQKGLDRVKTYGAGADHTKKYWRRIVDELVGHQCVRRTNDQYPILKLTEKGREVLFGRAKFEIVRRKEEAEEEQGERQPCNEELFERLRPIRKRLADAEGLPAFTVFHDRTLREMARYFPDTPEKMRKITGVGDVKLRNYGNPFLREIRIFLRDHPEIEPPPMPSERSRRRRGPPGRVTTTLEKTWELVEEGLDCEQIAKRRDLSPATIAGHVERLIRAGRPIERDRFVDPRTFRRLEKLFDRLGTDRLAPVVEATDLEVSYGEARLVRAFLTREGRQEGE